MATVSDIVSDAFGLIGQLAIGETLPDAEAQQGLATLNRLLDALWLERLAVYRVNTESFTWTGGQTSRTMGSGGNFDTTRPARILSAFQRVNSVDYPIRVVDESQYRPLDDKTTGSDLIERIYADYGVSLVTLYAYPVPSTSVSVHIQSHARLTTVSALTDTVTLPPGYEELLVYRLALRLMPWYPGATSAETAREVKNTARALTDSIKRINYPSPEVTPEVALMNRGGSGSTYSIYSDS